MSYWGQRCSNSVNTSVPELMRMLLPSCGVTIAGFCACAIISGVFYVQWLRLDAEGKKQSWRLHGWFTALSCIGSCAGAVGWGARMQGLRFYYEGDALGDSLGEQALRSSLFSNGFRHSVVHLVFYPIEFLCLSIAKMLMLDRLRQFAFIRASAQQQEVAGRLFLGAVLLGNLTGLVASFCSAGQLAPAVSDLVNSAEAYSANQTDLGRKLYDQAFEKFNTSLQAYSFQNFAEVVVLLLIILAFVLVSVSSAQIIKNALLKLTNAKSSIQLAGAAGDDARNLVDAASAAGRQLRRKVVGTLVVVFSTFVLRAISSTMLALANALQDVGKNCSENLCDECFNVYTHIRTFIVYSPAFSLLVILISSPLTLLVALWGATDVRALEHTAAKRQQLDTLR